jgi:hypothetical protein
MDFLLIGTVKYDIGIGFGEGSKQGKPFDLFHSKKKKTKDNPTGLSFSS